MPTINGIKVTSNQAEVYGVIKDYGPLPDHALVPLAQHVVNSPQSSSGIRSRRSELSRIGLLTDKGRIKTRSGRHATRYGVA